MTVLSFDFTFYIEKLKEEFDPKEILITLKEESEKIITTHASIKPNFTFSENEFFNQNVYGIEINEDQNVKYFLCLLNSNITNFPNFIYSLVLHQKLFIMTTEKERMLDKNWKTWGPYLSNRQWGTVR